MDEKFKYFEKDLIKFRAKVASEAIEKWKHALKVTKKFLPFPYHDVANTRAVYMSQSLIEGRVFIYKMIGDFNRHLWGISSGETKVQAAKKAINAYEVARKLGSRLSKAHPYVIALKLNLSIYINDVFKDKKRSIVGQKVIL